jgi:pimeloyl-ACP methyl ester carboxylesterase
MDTERLETYTNDGLTFDVTDTGPPDGPVVVLLHGFPQRGTCWFRVTELLNGRGYRTLAPDQRGYSSAARPRGRHAYRLPALVGDVEALLRLAGEPVHLVGHDWGSVVAWATAAQHPELTASLVTVSAPHPRAFRRSLFTSAQAARSVYAAAFQLPLLPELLAYSVPHVITYALGRSGMAEDAVDRFRREIIDDGAFGPALGWYRAVPIGGLQALAGPVDVPTTHVWSDGDEAVSRAGAELSGRYVRAPYRLVVMEGVSHWVPEEAPELLADLIEERAGSPSQVRP